MPTAFTVPVQRYRITSWLLSPRPYTCVLDYEANPLACTYISHRLGTESFIRRADQPTRQVMEAKSQWIYKSKEPLQ
jgi:hypothetical protein